LMMELCNTQTMATISHGIGTIEFLLRSLKGCSRDCPKNLVVFHMDRNDYEFTTHSYDNS
ncbi:MAG TPA: hypothetical protein D7I06_04545, partial [Candidatus Poseidoniales archaeon]